MLIIYSLLLTLYFTRKLQFSFQLYEAWDFIISKNFSSIIAKTIDNVRFCELAMPTHSAASVKTSTGFCHTSI